MSFLKKSIFVNARVFKLNISIRKKEVWTLSYTVCTVQLITAKPSIILFDSSGKKLDEKC